MGLNTAKWDQMGIMEFHGTKEGLSGPNRAEWGNIGPNRTIWG